MYAIASPMASVSTAKPYWATAIKARREEIGISQEELALRADLSPSLVTKLERGTHNPLQMRVENLLNILLALQWSAKDFEEATKMRLPLAGSAELKGFVITPALGVAEAGRPSDYPAPIEVYRPGSSAYTVRGQSMEPNIMDGEWVLVDETLTTLCDGKVYLLELAGEGHTVKRARKLNGSWYLVSDNPAYASFKPDEARIVGQVYYAAGGRKV